MLNSEAVEKEQRDYQWLFDRIRTIIGDVVDPLKDDIRETKELAKETRDKLNGKAETVIRNEERIMSLENRNKEEKTETQFNWTKALSIVSIFIAFLGAGIALLIYLRR